MPESTDPDLILRVTQETHAGEKQLKFVAKARDPRHRLYLASFDSGPLGSDAQHDVQRLVDEISQMPRDLSTEWSEDSLAGHGAELLERLVPIGLRRRLWELRGAVRTLHVLSDEVWIPWELLRLEDPAGHGDGHFLVEAFSVTRWLLELDPVLELPLRRVALVMPKDSELPTSSAEGARLKELGGTEHEVREVPASYTPVRDALAAGLFDGWHFAGHGVEPKDSPHGAGIRLEGGVRLHPNNLHGPARKLGSTRPLVFLNACHSGRGATWLSGMAGLGSAFLTAGAGAFIGAHWEVEDEPAYRFAEALYSSFFSGHEIGEAVRQARAKLHQGFPGTSDWLAYTVFAHPLARCAPAVEQREEPERQARKRPLSQRKGRKAAAPAQRTASGTTRDAPIGVADVVEPPPPEPPKPAGPAPGTELVNEQDGTVLLYVPGGEVALGAEGIHPWSRPVRRVRLSPFWIGRNPITNEQYRRFLDENPAADPPAFWEDPRFNQPRQPVVGVSWEEARAYCRWAGLELPTEAQWEAAARGTDRRPYPWGKEPPTPRHANFNGTSGGTTPVDAHPAGAGPYGTLDQAGNVWEWCADPWASNLYQLLQDDQVDPVARGDGAVRALRGGSWMNPAKDLHAAYRDRGTAKLRFNTQGFRCVRRPT